MPPAALTLLPRDPAPLTEVTEWDRIESLATRVLDGLAPWSEWWLLTAPHLEQWVGSASFVGRLATDEDHRREIVVQTWEKLQERDHAKLRAFFDRPRDGEPDGGRRFRAWVRRVVKNISIDYMRSLPEFTRKRPGAAPAAPVVTGERPPSHHYWKSIVSITSNVGALADDTEGKAEAQRMLEFLDTEISARRRRAIELAERGTPVQVIARELGLRDVGEADRVVARARERLKFRAALQLWSHGYTDGEIAAQLDLADERAAERMIKAAKELLRRYFRP